MVQHCQQQTLWEYLVEPVRANRFSYNVIFILGAVVGWAVGHWLI